MSIIYTAEEILSDQELMLTDILLQSLADRDIRILAKKVFKLQDFEELDTQKVKDACIKKLNTEISKQNLNEFMSKEENQVQAVIDAIYYREGFGSNWFTISEVMKRLKGTKGNKNTTSEGVKGQLETLKLFGLVNKKTYTKGRTKYKINMSAIERVKKQRREKANVDVETDTK